MFTSRNRLLLAKEESTYGVDASPDVNDALEVSGLKLNFTADLLTRDNVRSNISPVAPVVGKRSVEVTFSVELKGSGTKGVAPAIGDLLEACAFAETVSVGSSVVYKPCSTGKKSVTLWIYDNSGSASAVVHKVIGALGSFTLKLTAGQYASLDMTFKGNYSAGADVGSQLSPTYESTIPPVVESVDFTLNGVDSLVVQEVSINMDNNISERDDINSPNGLKGYEITSREPKGNFNPEAVQLSEYDFWADWIASSQRAMSAVVGTVAGNKCTISAPVVVLESIADGDRNSILTRDIPFRIAQNLGNDELVLTFS